MTFKNKRIDNEVLFRIEIAIKHRGPDDRGIFIDKRNNLYLLHNRLSIIDLSKMAHQPMQDAENKCVIVYNGEIYNYQEIRKELEEKGYKFFSNSDTEVILKAYREWGELCLEKFRGMFSFCIWNENEKKLFLARDRFGIKPLYYYFDNNLFIFASEIKAILASGLIKTELDFESIGLFLSLGYIPALKTIYKNIFSLEPAHFLIVSQNKIDKQRYYNLKEVFSTTPLKISEEEAIQCVRQELVDCVKHHLVSDVEVGAFLSGGIDSTSIVSLMRQVGQEKIKTVSVVFPRTTYDESKFTDIVSKKFKTKHLKVEVGVKDLIEHLEKIFYFMDQPTIDGINTYFISLVARRASLKTVLSGLGGDEVFGGYPSFKDIPEICNSLRFLKHLPLAYLLRNISSFGQEKIKTLINKKDITLPEIYSIYRGLFSESQISKILIPELAKKILSDSWLQRLHKLQIERFKDDFLKVSFLETNFYLQGQLLRDTDIFSMAHSLEVRVPFVDHRLIELLCKIPNKFKIGELSKKLLVDAVGDLPAEIYRRPKMTFTFPFDLWLRNGLRPVVENELKNSKIFNQGYVQDLLSEFYNRKLHWSRIWSLFILNKFINNGAVK